MDLFAAQKAAMDLVITIDNSTSIWFCCHLVPTGAGCWIATTVRGIRTKRLFRQPKTGDWQTVVQRVQNAIA